METTIVPWVAVGAFAVLLLFVVVGFLLRVANLQHAAFVSLRAEFRNAQQCDDVHRKAFEAGINGRLNTLEMANTAAMKALGQALTIQPRPVTDDDLGRVMDERDAARAETRALEAFKFKVVAALNPLRPGDPVEAWGADLKEMADQQIEAIRAQRDAALARVGHREEAINRQNVTIEDLCAKLNPAKEALQAARAFLIRIDDCHHCPDCGRSDEREHAPDCCYERRLDEIETALALLESEDLQARMREVIGPNEVELPGLRPVGEHLSSATALQFLIEQAKSRRAEQPEPPPTKVVGDPIKEE